jgi:hypothetical protein
VAHLLNDFVGLARAKGAYSAPQNVAEEAVIQTVVDLCERAGVWRHTYAFTLQLGVADYPIDVPDGTRLVCVDTVRINNTTYRAQPHSLMCRCGGWGVSIPNRDTVLIQPTPYPVCDVHVELLAWLAPVLENCEIPDALWQEYSDTIANGAASRLMQLPKQDWTNQGLAGRYFNLYEAGVTRAKNKRVLELTTGPLMMRGSYF